MKKKRVDIVTACKALADPTRLKILDLLRAKGRTCCELVARTERGLCACDIEEAVGLSQASISHHMGLLKRSGLVAAQRRGRWVFYSRNEAAIAALAAILASVI